MYVDLARAADAGSACAAAAEAVSVDARGAALGGVPTLCGCGAVLAAAMPSTRAVAASAVPPAAALDCNVTLAVSKALAGGTLSLNGVVSPSGGGGAALGGFTAARAGLVVGLGATNVMLAVVAAAAALVAALATGGVSSLSNDGGSIKIRIQSPIRIGMTCKHNAHVRTVEKNEKVLEDIHTLAINGLILAFTRAFLSRCLAGSWFGKGQCRKLGVVQRLVDRVVLSTLTQMAQQSASLDVGIKFKVRAGARRRKELAEGQAVQ